MTLWLLFAGSFAFAVVLPLLLSPWFGDRNRLLALSVSGYLVVLGLVFLLGTVYVAISTGQVGISVRGNGGTAAFADEPVVATLLLLINLACSSCFMALGAYSLRHALQPGQARADGIESPSRFSAAERAAVEPEARRQLERRFPGLGRVQAPHYDALLQGQIEEILLKRARGQPQR